MNESRNVLARCFKIPSIFTRSWYNLEMNKYALFLVRGIIIFSTICDSNFPFTNGWFFSSVPPIQSSVLSRILFLVIDVKKVYVSIIDAPDHLVREDKKAFSWEEYFKEPHLYRSIFSEEVGCPVKTKSKLISSKRMLNVLHKGFFDVWDRDEINISILSSMSLVKSIDMHTLDSCRSFDFILSLAISWQWRKHAGAACKRVCTLFVFVCARAGVRNFKLFHLAHAI